ncbi:Transposable element Tc3 transposase [Araneus ventricosus]|uniref:Transposable element Tc3 transposase n=1 Tax=Araneus ventricosus TaxID=182803 RepID=A0A4Y2M927_ARAVE|nr:Transposable element Tc3 transposase [Araneus ventricosus]
MVWGGFATEVTTSIVFVQGRVNSQSYADILADNLLPEAPLIMSGVYLFQQDNASVHVSETSKSWFDANFVKLLDWPARCLDLNPVENLWGILAHEVYKMAFNINQARTHALHRKILDKNFQERSEGRQD